MERDVRPSPPIGAHVRTCALTQQRASYHSHHQNDEPHTPSLIRDTGLLSPSPQLEERQGLRAVHNNTAAEGEEERQALPSTIRERESALVSVRCRIRARKETPRAQNARNAQARERRQGTEERKGGTSVALHSDRVEKGDQLGGDNGQSPGTKALKIYGVQYGSKGCFCWCRCARNMRSSRMRLVM